MTFEDVLVGAGIFGVLVAAAGIYRDRRAYRRWKKEREFLNLLAAREAAEWRAQQDPRSYVDQAVVDAIPRGRW